MSFRIACFLLPLFPLAARLRSEPDLLHEAVAIVTGNGNAAHVVAATRRARQAGIRVGLSLPQARAILPRLIARGRDVECERAAQEALLEIGEQFSPRVEDAGEGIVYLDLSGMHAHYASVSLREADESRWLLDAERSLAQSAVNTGAIAFLPIRVGIAASKLAARIAAESPRTPVIVPPGEEQSFLAPLPLTRLTPQLEASATLSRWGIAFVGELAGLPEGEVATRLGEIGRALHYAARGIDPTPLIPRQLPPLFEEGTDLEWAAVSLEPFLFIANAALDRLVRRMEIQGFSCTRLTISLRLEPDGFYDRSIELPAPTRDVKTMLTLLRLDLEANPPGAPVAGFTLRAHPDRPRRAQLSLFGPPAMSPDKLATSIARIASLIGPDRIGTAEIMNTYRPEACEVRAYDPPPPPEIRRKPRRNRGLLAVRVFRPPVELEVVVEEGQETRRQVRSRIAEATGESQPLRDPASGEFIILRPGDLGYDKRSFVKMSPVEKSLLEEDRPPYLPDTQLKSIKAITEAHDPRSFTPTPMRIEGTVRVASGPWRLEEGWWSDSPAARDYWDLELTGGAVYRVFHERSSGRWWVDGMYD